MPTKCDMREAESSRVYRQQEPKKQTLLLQGKGQVQMMNTPREVEVMVVSQWNTSLKLIRSWATWAFPKIRGTILVSL